MHSAYYDAGIPFISNDDYVKPPPPSNTDHLLWDTHMFPSSELNDRYFSPTVIIRNLAIHDDSRFNTPVTKQFLKSHFFDYMLMEVLTAQSPTIATT